MMTKRIHSIILLLALSAMAIAGYKRTLEQRAQRAEMKKLSARSKITSQSEFIDSLLILHSVPDTFNFSKPDTFTSNKHYG